MHEVDQGSKAVQKTLGRTFREITLCSRYFEADCFVTEGKEYQEELLGIPPQKRLKPDAVLTIFPKSVDYLEASSSTSMITRPLNKRRQQKPVRK